MPDYQSAFRKNYSCETALIKLTNDLLWTMERQEVIALVAVDLSAAFDAVDHSILLAVLREKFGIHDTALKWFSNYLQPRSCCVNIAKEYSKDISLTFSVPQGSCAGLVLYLVYASTLQEVIPGNFQLHGYADAHIFKCAFNANDRKAEIETVTSIESCAQDIKAWMYNNRLRMNSSKTELILFGNSEQVAKCQTKELNINQEKVQLTDTSKYLGVWLDK